jgi:hypothetical protein
MSNDDFGNDDFGHDDSGDVVMGGTAQDAAVTDAVDQKVVVPAAAPAPANNKRSRFIEAQRKRQEERKRQHAAKQAEALARVQAAKAATERAIRPIVPVVCGRFACVTFEASMGSNNRNCWANFIFCS